MSYFSNPLTNTILEECENARNEGQSIGSILKALADIICFISEYWLETL